MNVNKQTISLSKNKTSKIYTKKNKPFVLLILKFPPIDFLERHRKWKIDKQHIDDAPALRECCPQTVLVNTDTLLWARTVLNELHILSGNNSENKLKRKLHGKCAICRCKLVNSYGKNNLNWAAGKSKQVWYAHVCVQAINLNKH